MACFLLVALQVAALAFSGLAVAVHAVPFTPEGLVGTPSRLQAGLFILTEMPFQGIPFLQALRVLFWVPVLTGIIGLLACANPFRPLRWAGAVCNLAALGYLYHMIPAVVTVERMPLPVILTGALFVCSAVLLLIPQEKTKKGNTAPAAFILFLLWLGTMAILGPAAFGKDLSPAALAVAMGCLLALSLSFYALGKISLGIGTKKGTSGVFLLVPLIAGGLFVYFSPPLALPVGAGFLVLLAAVFSQS